MNSNSWVRQKLWLLQRLDQMLQDVSQQVGTFRFTKDDVSRILKDVAEFRAPGVYVLKEYVRRKDLEPMQKALTSPKSGTTDLSLQACSTQN